MINELLIIKLNVVYTVGRIWILGRVKVSSRHFPKVRVTLSPTSSFVMRVIEVIYVLYVNYLRHSSTLTTLIY